jgi:hypothetical protein
MPTSAVFYLQNSSFYQFSYPLYCPTNATVIMSDCFVRLSSYGAVVMSEATPKVTVYRTVFVQSAMFTCLSCRQLEFYDCDFSQVIGGSVFNGGSVLISNSTIRDSNISIGLVRRNGLVNNFASLLFRNVKFDNISGQKNMQSILIDKNVPDFVIIENCSFALNETQVPLIFLPTSEIGSTVKYFTIKNCRLHPA